MIPINKPINPNFSSGPCSKRPGYELAKLDITTLGRSHRSNIGKTALQQAIKQTKELLKIPDDYRIAIVPASDTGAMEMMLWSLLGTKPVDVCYWESFGKGWFSDIKNELQISNVNAITADYGQLPDLTTTNPEHDIVFTWNGTTSGVKVPNADWISDQRTGLTICDATSAVFAMPMAWDKLDVTTFSWQKVLGGEGAHGMIVLSPAAVERLESYTPPWPLPKIFRLTKNGKLIEGIFTGATINTPSMLCVADYLDALNWVDAIGGINVAISRSENNLAILANFVDQHEWIDFLAERAEYRSNTSVCLRLTLSDAQLKAYSKLLAQQQVAYDINSYKDAPSGLRIWCGATVESHDLELLLPWLVWAYESVLNKE
ncbi:phosphoserine transaminase [Moritella viscosa]|uniref:phosphoserine transaminase n=1 Tax=Moritella viscosa TaxID=80854 RepID=A0A090IHP2_9GAMM|nr:phosphoserine transaminase [Moritella viscosa]CED62205.1 phosphoserine aminotransferase [Moritella viscosa]SGY92837.1 Phosphoserine aminotransferase [Moritella viscosa]SGY97885.1 Phosphoserine aminotransferase [Moritella viscosa]SGZ03508.1 Phosphoserine aminotransferase [Moritella viscosa]SGZ03851.1 Phosphoserine aminotransferase [Moritella viscosa]